VGDEEMYKKMLGAVIRFSGISLLNLSKKGGRPELTGGGLVKLHLIGGR
jgi:hypothetical protein